MTAGQGGPRPPRLAEALLTWCVDSTALGRSIVGDAREEWAARRKSGSSIGAAAWYWWHVLRFVLTYRSGGEPREKGGFALSAALHQALRGLSRRPGFSIAVVATLCLGVGATTLGFAMVDGVLLRPLPYDEPGQLMHVSRVDPDWFSAEPGPMDAGSMYATPPATFFDWEERARSFSHMGGYGFASGALQDDAEPVRVFGSTVTSGVFAALGVSAQLGRFTLPEDDEPGAAPVLVLSHGLWLRQYGGDPGVVGRTVTMDGVSRTVIGVMPERFRFPRESADFWRPLDEVDRVSEGRSAGFMHAVARLAPGVEEADARGEMTRITQEMAGVHAIEGEFQALVFPLQEVTVAGVRSGLLLLLSAALVVLMVGCVNVTNLFLARSAERRREFAVRAAIGAGSKKLAGLVLGESLLLMGLGGAMGTLVARVLLAPFLDALPMNIPRATEITIDGRVALVTLVLTVGLGLLIALIPAAQIGRSNLNATLRDGGRGAAGGRMMRSRGALIVAEVALAVVLVSVSGLFLESYRISMSRDQGYDAEDAVSAYLSVPALWEAGVDARLGFYSDVTERLAAVSGVRSVAVASQMPLMGSFSSPPAGVETVDGVEETIIHSSVVSAEYFETLDIPILAGRGFDSGDVEGGAPVAIVSEALAQQYWPGESPIGKRVRIGTEENGVWHDVAGMAGNVRYRFAGSETVEYYRAMSQYPLAGANVVMETEAGAVGVAEAAADVIRDVLPAQSVTVALMADRFRDNSDYRWARLASVLLTGLGLVAVLLAILGIYGVLSYAVVQRTREIGIRVSLGGTSGEILRSVLGRFLILAGMGIALGVGLAVAAESVVQSALVGEAPTGPWVLVWVSALVLLTVIVASLVPAVRALRVDPLVAFGTD